MRFSFILLAAFAAALCACAPDNEPFLFRSALMGYLQEDGSLKGDDGRIYYFSNVQDSNGWEDVKRLMVLIDVTEKITPTPPAFSITKYRCTKSPSSEMTST